VRTQGSKANLDRAPQIIDAALSFGINPSLEPMKAVCAQLGKPQQNYTCIQVGGTNGKSSTSRYLAALLRAAGFTTALYTSPELVSITERIDVNGSPVEEDVFAAAILKVSETALQNCIELTEFELITAAALCIFADQKVEYAVLEVGLGGRWDATSVASPALVVLTGVDLDHTALLGDTVEEIAAEKAAIIKQGTTVVAAPTHLEAFEVFKGEARERQARFIEVPRASKPEENSYQAQNKLTAFTAACELLGKRGPSEDKAYQIMDATVIPGRLETVHTNPLVIIDAAHNPASARMLQENFSIPNALLLLAILADKDAEGIIKALAPHFDEITVTQTASPRALPIVELQKQVEMLTGKAPRAYATPQVALDELLKQPRPVLATGSITLAGAVKGILTFKKQ